MDKHLNSNTIWADVECCEVLVDEDDEDEEENDDVDWISTVVFISKPDCTSGIATAAWTALVFIDEEVTKC